MRRSGNTSLVMASPRPTKECDSLGCGGWAPLWDFGIGPASQNPKAVPSHRTPRRLLHRHAIETIVVQAFPENVDGLQDFAAALEELLPGKIRIKVHVL